MEHSKQVKLFIGAISESGAESRSDTKALDRASWAAFQGHNIDSACSWGGGEDAWRQALDKYFDDVEEEQIRMEQAYIQDISF